jgi:hypothetical protein
MFFVHGPSELTIDGVEETGLHAGTVVRDDEDRPQRQVPLVLRLAMRTMSSGRQRVPSSIIVAARAARHVRRNSCPRARAMPIRHRPLATIMHGFWPGGANRD